jgi:hypothetical protein
MKILLDLESWRFYSITLEIKNRTCLVNEQTYLRLDVTSKVAENSSLITQRFQPTLYLHNSRSKRAREGQ